MSAIDERGIIEGESGRSDASTSPGLPTTYKRGDEMAQPNATFDRKLSSGLLDFDSGAWDFDSNQRACHCGRCGIPVRKGEGKPYNEFMSDGYRASTRYLCDICVATLPVENRGK